MTNVTLAEQFLSRLSAKEHPEAIRNVQYSYELKQRRLERFGVRVKSSFSDNGILKPGELFSWEDKHYRESCICHTGELKTIVEKDGKTLYKETDSKIFYTSVTDSKGESISRKDDYCCPNCGSVSTVEQLISGCSFCGTRFEMSELYPKVSLDYNVKNQSMTKDQMKGQIKRFMIPTGLVFLVINLIGCLIKKNLNIGALIVAVITSIIGGVILGYMLWAIGKLGSVFGQAGKSLGMLGALGSDKKFSAFMSRYSPEFSFEHFRGEVISLLKILIYSDSDTELPFYLGKENHLFENVIESSFRGALKLENYAVKNNICTLKVKAFLENLHLSGNKVEKKDEEVYLTLQKDLSCAENFPFGIHAVKCRSCGGSFDAYKERTCPYCDSPYQAKDLGWLVTDFQKA